jgi:post-segregation antitoxin (ccd killing protein)
MKKKLTVTIDQDLIPVAKDRARMEGLSLSELIETALRRLTARDRTSFSARWRGRFEPADREDDRYRALAEKYL